jgi:hypothetical protein
VSSHASATEVLPAASSSVGRTWGAGGCGGRGGNLAAAGSGGGGGPGASTRKVLSVLPGTSYPISIGVGGAGGNGNTVPDNGGAQSTTDLGNPTAAMIAGSTGPTGGSSGCAGCMRIWYLY